MKKIITSIMAMIMVLMISVPVSATNNGKITITNDSETTGVSMKGHTYEAYKIMDVTIKVDEKNNNNYEYKVTGTPFENFFKQMQESQKAEGNLDKWATTFVRSQDLNELSKKLSVYISTNNVKATKSATATEESVTIDQLPLGYYLVLDKGASGSEVSGSAAVIASAALGTTNDELVIKLKASAPTIEKDIYHNEIPGIDNVGDNAIGEKVHFRLSAKIPSNLAGYETYDYIIHDKMSKGLTFNGESDFHGVFVPMSGGKKRKLNGYYTLTENVECKDKDNNPEIHTFHLEIDVLKATEDYAADEAKGKAEHERRGFPAGRTLEVFYDATLNKDAAIAPAPNTNEVYLEFSNDPSDNNSTTTTPEDIVKDYTFALNALKTGEDGQTPLAGAEFKLYDTVGGEKNPIYFKNVAEEGQEPIPYKEVNGVREYYVCNEQHQHLNKFDTIITSETGKFKIIGLDDSKESNDDKGYRYTLEESKAPEGYTPIDPINFKFYVKYDENGDVKSFEVISDGNVIGQDSFALNTTIVNTTANKLPETGGIGTTIFKVVGIALMISAAVGIVIATKKGPKNA